MMTRRIGMALIGVVALAGLCWASFYEARRWKRGERRQLDYFVVQSEKLVPLTTYPINDYRLESDFKSTLLEKTTFACWGKGLANPAILCHAIRFAKVPTQRSQPKSEKLDDFVRQTLLLATDDNVYEHYGSPYPLLLDTAYGAAYRIAPSSRGPAASLSEVIGGAGHTDQILANLLEAGTSLDKEIVTASKTRSSLRDVLNDSLLRFSFEAELEWSVVAYSHCLKWNDKWVTVRREKVCLSDIVQSLLEKRRFENGACNGAHRAYALAVAYSSACSDTANTAARNTDTFHKLDSFLAKISQCLSKTQRDDGSWDSHWYFPLEPPLSDDQKGIVEVVEYEDSIRVTGHLLEAMAYLPSSRRPPDSVLRQGVAYLEHEFRQNLDYCNQKMILPTTHAVRALCLLSN